VDLAGRRRVDQVGRHQPDFVGRREGQVGRRRVDLLLEANRVGRRRLGRNEDLHVEIALTVVMSEASRFVT